MTESLAAAWSRCTPYIEAALRHSGETHTVEDVRLGVERGDFHFWPGSHCALVTEFQESPRIKRLNFWLGGGDLKEILAMRPHIERWAKAHGCREAIMGGVFGKRGWTRIGERTGFSPRWVVFSKDLA